MSAIRIVRFVADRIQPHGESVNPWQKVRGRPVQIGGMVTRDRAMAHTINSLDPECDCDYFFEVEALPGSGFSIETKGQPRYIPIVCRRKLEMD